MKYNLYDLEIETIGDPATFNCSHKIGDTLLIKGENLSFKPGTKQFSHYALATLMPYIAAKQRVEQKSDWMFYETDIACPDPKCGAKFHIKQVGKHSYKY
jgi:uncharacterized repeat protein (TIGR04076 family)